MREEKSDKKLSRDLSTRGDRSSAVKQPRKQPITIDQETFKRILDVIGKKVEMIEYLHTTIEGRMPEDVIQEVVKLLDYAKFIVTLRGNPWVLGDSILPMSAETDFDYFQIYLAHGAAIQLQATEVTLDCAISDESNFIRGYSSDGKALDTKTVDSLDKLFNAWLATMKFESKDGATYNLISKDGAIFKATKATIWLDSQGEPVRVDPEEFKLALDRKSNGLEAYIQQQNKDIGITIQQHEFPREEDEIAPD